MAALFSPYDSNRSILTYYENCHYLDMDEEPAFVVPDRWRRGRGTDRDPGNRFESIRLEPGPDWNPDEDVAPQTRIVDDDTKSVISRHKSPDLPFAISLNPYRGCEHGCSYCYARPYHEYLGLSSGLDFESLIIAKRSAPELLREELSTPTWKPQTLVMSGVTDCYQPVERRLRITRGCLEVLAELRHPVALITKNALITRDIDLLAELAQHQAVAVTISVTSLRQDLQQKLEPRASVPATRLAAIKALADAGIPVGVNVAPIIPGLTDHEMPAIVAAAVAAGAQHAGYTMCVCLMRWPSSSRHGSTTMSHWERTRFCTASLPCMAALSPIAASADAWSAKARTRGKSRTFSQSLLGERVSTGHGQSCRRPCSVRRVAHSSRSSAECRGRSPTTFLG
jgi:DNA repair photolyase